MKNKGFTLIELLVVIAIIGILASVVLASLNAAREKGRDSAIKNQMAQMRTEAALFYSDNGSFIPGSGTGGLDDTLAECSSSSNGQFVTKFTGSIFDSTATNNIEPLVVGVHTNSQSAGTRVKCGAYAGTWAFAAPLHNPEAGMTGWCVDSTGAAKAINTNFETASTGELNGGTNIARCP